MSTSAPATRSRLGRAAVSTGLSSALIGATLGVVALTSTAHASDSPEFIDGNPKTCADAGLEGEILEARHYPQDDPEDIDHFGIEYTISDDGTRLFITVTDDWLQISGTVVKGGPDANVWYGDPEQFVDGMYAPNNGGHTTPEISHWFICGEVVPGEPVPSESPEEPEPTEPPEEPEPTEPPEEPEPTEPPEEPEPTEPPEEPEPTEPPAEEPTTGPSPTEEPGIQVEVLNPICDGDVPYLQYLINADEVGADDVTITWVNPDGEDVVYADVPLEGRVLWPGAEVDEDGNPLDWPGWRFEDGQWVEGDEFDWVRPSVEVVFEVNPSVTVSVDYPPSSPDCNANPPGETPSEAPEPSEPGEPDLPDTGTGVGPALGAALLIAGGAALALYGRKVSRQSI